MFPSNPSSSKNPDGSGSNGSNDPNNNPNNRGSGVGIGQQPDKPDKGKGKKKRKQPEAEWEYSDEEKQAELEEAKIEARKRPSTRTLIDKIDKEREVNAAATDEVIRKLIRKDKQMEREKRRQEIARLKNKPNTDWHIILN